MTAQAINLDAYRPTTLADKGTLIKLRKRGVTQRKTDLALLERIAAAENIPVKKLSAGIRILDDVPEIKAWEAKARETVEAWKVASYRWFDDGTRYVVTEDPVWYQGYLTNLRNLIAQCDQLRVPVEQDWERIVSDDMAASRFKLTRDDYPRDLGNRLMVELITLPVPHENDFRTNVSEGERAALRSMLKETQRSATVDLAKRLLTPLGALAEKLKSYDPKAKGRWSTAVVDNLVSQADLIIDLNRRFEHDLEVEKLAQTAKKIVAPLQNPETAKGDPETREKTKERLDKLSTILGGFGGE